MPEVCAPGSLEPQGRPGVVMHRLGKEAMHRKGDILMLSRKVLAALLLGLVLVGPALALNQTDVLNYEVRLPQAQIAPTYQNPSEEQANALLPSLVTFRTAEGNGWKVLQWNPLTGTPSTLGGPPIPAVSSDASDEAIRAAVESFVARNANLVLVNARDLRSGDIINLGQDRKYMVLTQYHDGLEVIGGRVDVALWQGQIVLLGSDAYRNIEVSTIPTVRDDEAIAAAHLGIPTSSTDGATQPPRLVILPLAPDGIPVYHLAWEVFLKTSSPENVWRTYVDAHDAKVLWRESTYAFYQITGSSKGNVEMTTVGDPYVLAGLEDARVRASTSYVGYTDEAGNYVVEVPNNTTYVMDTALYGLYCNVNRSDGADAALSVNGSPSAPVDFEFNDSNSHPAERDAYYHVNGVHDWIKSIDPGFTQLDYVMSANVNSTAGTCNAFWNGSSVNFYLEGGGCNNSGRIADVIHHEYGHGITQKYYNNNPPTASGMGEGFSDAYAMAMANDPIMGEDFYTSGAPVRDGNNLRQYPGTECGGEVHCLGEIIMGAIWKTQHNFYIRYGSTANTVWDPLLVAAIKTRQTTMPNFLTRLLMADDTDGNLNNGTQNWYEICDAFAIHNLPCPALVSYVTIAHTPLDDQTAQTGPYTMTCIATSVGGGTIDPANIKIFYTTDAEDAPIVNWQSVLMTATGNPNEFTGAIPDQGCGEHVRYYIRAAKLTGEYETAPHLAPYRGTYHFMTGPFTVALNDDCEVDRGWTSSIDAGVAGQFERVDPVGKTSGTYGVTQPEDDHTSAGTLCWVTDGRGGTWSSYDVDGGRTYITSPTFDWSLRTGAAEVRWWSFFFDYTPTDDSLRVAYSVDNGATWKQVYAEGGMALNSWNFHKAYINYDPSNPFTNQTRIRFSMEDIGNTTCAEAAVDDIEIRIADVNACTGGADDSASLPARFQVEQNRPNPFNPKTTIRFALPTAGKVEVTVFDAGGRRVRTLVNGMMPAGTQAITWDGRDDANHELGSGVYYYTVRAGADTSSRKMMLLK